MIQKNFNLYTQQSFIKNSDSITRELDNEWDFPMYQDHDGQVSLRGLTMSFSGGWTSIGSRELYVAYGWF